MTLALLCGPLVGAILCCLLPSRLSRWIALITSVLGVFLGLQLYFAFNAHDPNTLQFPFSLPWIRSMGIRFALAVDGLSFPFLLLTKGIMPVAVLASWNEQRHPKLFMVLYLLMDAAMVGTFLATDLFLFYVFWELVLVPMFFLIGVWGSRDRIYATLKFFLYTFAGSILMLVAILYLFGMQEMLRGQYAAEIHQFHGFVFPSGVAWAGLRAEDLVFLAFAIAFCIKIPLFPFHTWLPDAHVQAPAGGSVLLAAVLLKMGTYGLLRFAIPICPGGFERFRAPMAILSLIGALYGAWIAFQQSDLKKLVAYSSVSHLALVVLGICAKNSHALAGSVLQSINHGINTGALFFLVGVLYERRHTREFSEYGGLASVIPVFAFFLTLASLSSVAVPGLNGFVGEFLILAGSYQHNALWAGIAIVVVVFGAAYTLLFLRRILFGAVSTQNTSLADVRLHELVALVALSFSMIVLGLRPGVLLDKLSPMASQYWIFHGFVHE